LFESRHKPTAHEKKPEKEPYEKEQLPESAQVYVFISLVPKPEVLNESESLHDPEPLAN
jgi:hypothetical protein